MDPLLDSPVASRERAGVLLLIVLAHVAALWAITAGAPQSSSQQAAKVVSAFMVQAAPAAAVAPPRPAPQPPKPEPKPQPKPKPKPRIKPEPKPAILPPPVEPAPMPEPPASAVPNAPVTTPATALPTDAPEMGDASETAAPPPAQPKTITSGVSYIRRPEPKYPRLSRRLGEEGKVVLRVLIDERGRAGRIEIHQSSGSSRLDQAAREAVERARFKPYIENSRAIAVFAIIPIAFNLEN